MTNDNVLDTPEQTAAQIEVAMASTPNHYRDLAEGMLHSGEIDENSTIADARTALERRYPPQ